jgi:HKD family nuclease
MAKRPISVTFLEQAPSGPDQLFRRITTLLQTDDLQRFRIAVAYARWDGIGLIAPQLENFLSEGGEFQSIYGVANGVTTPDCLLYSLYLQDLYKKHSYAGAIEDEYANSIFHPKFFEFRFANRSILIVGSANLTGGGLLRNTELSVEIETPHDDPLEKKTDAAWKSMLNASEELTIKLVRRLKKESDLASEFDRGESRAKPSKPWLVSTTKTSPKPLFLKVLDLAKPAKRSKLLAKMDPLTVRPERLYLQILAYETGGQGDGHPGYQIQLPVATLATFFGVGEDESREATFHFPGEDATAHLTHFPNNTHRVRLLPLRDIKRPAIVVFRRIGDDEYNCSIVPSKDYTKALASKCTEQIRSGARKWGLEQPRPAGPSTHHLRFPGCMWFTAIPGYAP